MVCKFGSRTQKQNQRQEYDYSNMEIRSSRDWWEARLQTRLWILVLGDGGSSRGSSECEAREGGSVGGLRGEIREVVCWWLSCEGLGVRVAEHWRKDGLQVCVSSRSSSESCQPRSASAKILRNTDQNQTQTKNTKIVFRHLHASGSLMSFFQTQTVVILKSSWEAKVFKEGRYLILNSKSQFNIKKHQICSMNIFVSTGQSADTVQHYHWSSAFDKRLKDTVFGNSFSEFQLEGKPQKRNATVSLKQTWRREVILLSLWFLYSWLSVSIVTDLSPWL